MAITACTSGSEYITFSAGTDTPHGIYLVEEYDESISGTTVVSTIQCGTVKLGGNGYYS